MSCLPTLQCLGGEKEQKLWLRARRAVFKAHPPESEHIGVSLGGSNVSDMFLTGPSRKCSRSAPTSAYEGIAEKICSLRVFRFMTRTGPRRLRRCLRNGALQARCLSSGQQGTRLFEGCHRSSEITAALSLASVPVRISAEAGQDFCSLARRRVRRRPRLVSSIARASTQPARRGFLF